MAGASNYPKLIDTDTELLRRSGPDAMVPADHNNLVDALESVEQTIGHTGDGTEGGGAASFNCGVAHVVGMGSVAMPNPRYPYSTVHARSLYPVNRALPANWALNTGASASYTTPIPYMLLSCPSGASHYGARLALATSAMQAMVVRVRPDYLASASGWQWRMGWSPTGVMTDVYGWQGTCDGASQLAIARVVNGSASGSSLTIPIGLGYLGFLNDNGTGAFWWTPDGFLGMPYGDGSAPVTTGYFVIGSGPDATGVVSLYIDFAAYHNEVPDTVIY